MRQKGMANTATRKNRFRALAFAASVLAVAALAACHGTSGGGYSGGGNTGSGAGNTTGSVSSGTNGGGSSASVTGTVTWPDGQPAANASVYFYNYDPGFTANGWYDGKYGVQQLPADGSYSLSGCPCQDLTAYLYIPAPSGGQDCWIIMQDDTQTYSGLPASPGDVINWQAKDLPCSPTW